MNQNHGCILIVDDDEIIQSNISKYLLKMGFEVAVAENGVQALKMFVEKSFDLVLTDFQMPHMDGMVLAREIKRRHPKIPVIMMSGDSEVRTMTKDIADFFLSKPFELYIMYNLIASAFKSAS